MTDTATLPTSRTLVDHKSQFGTMTCTLFVRALILVIGFIAFATTTTSNSDLNHTTDHAWVAWDGGRYLHITVNGYPKDRSSEDFCNIAYFPLYPLATRALTAVMTPGTAMVVLSNVCAMIGFLLFYEWARRVTNDRTAMIGTLLAAVYPGAVFFAAGLTEGPFFMMVSAVLLLLYYDKFWWAAIIASISTATRPTGIALAAVVPIYAWIRTPQLSTAKRTSLFITLGLLSVLGGLIYEGFIIHRYGNWLAYFDAQRVWEVGDADRLHQQAIVEAPRYSVKFFLDKITMPQAWNRMMAVGIFAIIIVGFVKPGKLPRTMLLVPLIIFLMTYLPNNGLRASSIVRYEAPAAPLFLLIAIWLSDRKWKYVMVGIIGLLLVQQVYYAFLFPRGLWVG